MASNSHSFADYFWHKGCPRGKQLISASAELSYKIVADPYGKRLSVERYRNGDFDVTLYDTALLDYRLLMAEFPPEWERHSKEETLTVVRDPYDRVIWIEQFAFEHGKCRSCTVLSSHGLLLSRHRLFYRSFGDSFDGVELYDPEGRIVLQKQYAVDPDSGLFTILLSQSWEPIPL